MTFKKKFYFFIGLFLLVFVLFLYKISCKNRPLANINIQEIESVKRFPGNTYLAEDYIKDMFQTLKNISATKKPVQENDIIGEILLEIRYTDGTTDLIALYEYMIIYNDVIYETNQNVYALLELY